ANCFDASTDRGHISKRPWSERIAWAEDNRLMITRTARDPQATVNRWRNGCSFRSDGDFPSTFFKRAGGANHEPPRPRARDEKSWPHERPPPVGANPRGAELSRAGSVGETPRPVATGAHSTADMGQSREGTPSNSNLLAALHSGLEEQA